MGAFTLRWSHSIIQRMLLVGVWLLVFERPISAQPDTYWLSVGVGTSTMAGFGSDAGSLSASANYQFSSSMLSPRGTTNFEIFGDDLWDVGLLYNLATPPAVFHAAIGLGIAVVGGSRCEDCGLFNGGVRETIDPIIGLPAQVQLSFRPMRFLGLVLYGYGNLNREESFAGLTAGLQVGKLR